MTQKLRKDHQYQNTLDCTGNDSRSPQYQNKRFEFCNLCEDFLKIETVKDEEVAICCDIDVRPDTDMEEVQANVFYLIENYLNPSVNFYLLKEFMGKGIPVDEIFLGPKLNHGFIDTKELEATNLREHIYTSDIINLLMDIPGVLSVRNMMLTKYDANGNVVKGQSGLKWCMHISPQHKPVLSINRSKIVFFKNNFPFLATYAEIRDTLKLLRAGRERPKLKGQQDDLPLPSGQYHILEDYYSIQNDFPHAFVNCSASILLALYALELLCASPVQNKF